MLDRLCITGVDDTISIADLLQWSEYYPFVEWGVLYSPTREGELRYPSKKWRTEFEQACRGTTVLRSIHLCDQAVNQWFAYDKKLPDFQFYQRIQLNFDVKIKEWVPLVEDVIPWIRRMKASTSHLGTQQSIIVRDNQKNNIFVKNLSEQGAGTQLHVLYDSLIGYGKTLSDIQTVYPGHYTGYAVGINEQTIADIYHKIKDANSGSTAKYWLDLEIGILTTDNQWDRQKVNNLFKTCNIWYKTI